MNHLTEEFIDILKRYAIANDLDYEGFEEADRELDNMLDTIFYLRLENVIGVD